MSSGGSSIFQKGDVVWVLTGSNHEEPATVLEPGCALPLAGDEGSSNDDDEEDERQNNGILVRFNVSRTKGVYAPDKVRPFSLWPSPSSKDAQPATRTRRSTRSGGSNNRSVVTPSPLTTATATSQPEPQDSTGSSIALSGKGPAGSESTVVAKDSTDHDEKQPREKKMKQADDRQGDDGADANGLESAEVKEEDVKKPAAKGKRGQTTRTDKSDKSANTTKKATTTTSPHFRKAAASTTAAAGKEKKSKKATSTKANSRKKNTPTCIVIQNDSSEDDDDNAGQSVNKQAVLREAAAAAGCGEVVIESDNDADDDPPYIVEYATSGRATCRTCEDTIAKGSLRISYQGLFRGKPGFRVYRHLKCTTFGKEITKPWQVGGWKALLNKEKGADFAVLRKQIALSKERNEEEEKELDSNELVQATFAGEMRAPPPGLVANLLPFQTEGVSWMHHQEVATEIRGGVLADEMGMGKTLQTITTTLDNRPILQHCLPNAKHPPSAPDLQARVKEEALWKEATDSWKHEMKMINVSPRMWPKKNAAGARAGTLVICPVIAIYQWKAEIEKFCAPNTLTVGIYHGPNRQKEMPAQMMQKYDIVLTTYQCLEQGFRAMTSPNKVTCPNCGGKFKMDKLRVHLKYFCGENATRTEAQQRQRRGSNHRGGAAPARRGGGGKKDSKKKKPPLKTFAKQKKSSSPPAMSTKKKIRIQSRGTNYDSDSELSILSSSELAVASTGARRPSRSAAAKASKQMKASVKDWGHASQERGRSNKNNDDESSFASSSEDEPEESELSEPEESEDVEESSSSDDEPIAAVLAKPEKKKKTVANKATKKKGAGAMAPKRRAKLKKIVLSDDDEDSGDDEEEDDAVERARAMQRKALSNSKKRKSTATKGKKGPQAKKRKGTTQNAKGKKGKKKFDDESTGSSGGSDSSTDEEDDDDPLAGIDMKQLAEESMSGAKFSILHSFCWWRIVLDEAHFVKSRSSQTANAAFSLIAVHRWCLSGTPLQNRVGELYSLIRFLRIDPMAHYFCRQKGCDCKSLHYRIKEGICQDCGHRAFSHYAHFNKHVLNVIQREGYAGDGRRAMFKLKNEVLDKCLLRRTKETRAADMNLPPRIVTIRSIRLHPIEQDFYDALYMSTRSSFDDYVAEGTLLNNYAHIFDLLTKMRQAVDHPYLIVYSKTNMEKRLAAGKRQSGPAVANGSVDCDICHEAPTERVVSTCCRSGFCRSCVIEYLAGAGGESTQCPSCRNPFSIDLNQESVATPVDDGTLKITSSSRGGGSGSGAGPSLKELSHVPSGSILRRINLAEFATSTKVEVLIQELMEMRQQRPGSKALVFSQFVNMLDIIRWRLHSDPLLTDLGLGVRILHGGMDVKSRDAALKDFREDNNVRVLLMSLKAGGVALNLTVASEVFLMDNWWNPAAEMQAIDRTHRLGQYRPIRAVRFIAEGTVEERVLQLQEKKRLVFDGTVGRDAGSLKMLTVEDMKALFT